MNTKIFKSPNEKSRTVGGAHGFEPFGLIQKFPPGQFWNFDHIITLEEHTLVGGLFSRISQICMKHKFMPRSIISFGIPDTFPKVVGNQSYLRTYYGIDSKSITKEILKL